MTQNVASVQRMLLGVGQNFNRNYEGAQSSNVNSIIVILCK